MTQLPRTTAAALLCALPDMVAAVALAARQQTATPLPPPWITVDAAGSARTISPVLTVTDGTTSTISPPPAELTRVQTWRMSTDGVAITTATRAPIATATPPSGSGGGGGAMLKCQHYVGPDAPFCVPYRRSLLNPGTTYYCAPPRLFYPQGPWGIYPVPLEPANSPTFSLLRPKKKVTWDVNFFGSDPTQDIEVQVNYDGGHGFVSQKMPANVGYYAWTVPADLLEQQAATAMNVTWSLNFRAPDGSNSTIHDEGPTVTVTREQMLIDDGLTKGGGGNKLLGVYIAVPIVIALLLLGLGGFCLWSWRRKGVVPGAAAMGALKRRSGGYGERRSRSERAAGQQQQQQQPLENPALPRPAGPGDQLPDDKFPGIQLTDRDSWSPTSPSGGRNVFQEEIRRQEMGRR